MVIMKKLVSLVVLAIFILSVVPMALAQEDDNVDYQEDKYVYEKIDDQIDYEELKEEKPDDNVDYQENQPLTLGDKIDILKQKLIQSKERTEQLNDRNEDIKERLDRSRERFDQMKEKGEDIREKGEEYKEKVDDMREKGEEYKEQFDRSKEKVDEMRDRKDEFKDKLERHKERADERKDKFGKNYDRDFSHLPLQEREILKEKLANFKEKNEEMKERHEFNKEKFVQEKQKFEDAKVKYREKKKELTDKRQEIDHLKEKTRCEDMGEECQEKKKELRRGVKQHLIKTVELIKSSIEKLKHKIESSPQLDDEEKEEALSEVISLEERLTAEIAELEAMEDASPEEIKESIKELKHLWRDSKKSQRWIITQMINEKQENLVGVYARFDEKMVNQISKLEQEGADVSSLNDLLAVYEQKLENLAAASDAAKEAWVEAKSSDDPEAMAKARKKHQEFKEISLEAKKVLRELVGEFKEVRNELRADDDSDDDESTEGTDDEDDSEPDAAEDETVPIE